ncbi:MAG: phosphate ABC transporter permease PstA [Oscillospiraceae bacterium]|nr:phosphate ABC transporter permease PstA [Oscillospiraceae bacterium]
MNHSLCEHRRRPLDGLMKTLIYLCSAGTVFILAAMLLYILYRGLPQLSWQFLSSVPSSLKQVYGILPSIINTLYIVFITLLLATPIGIGGAIYLEEYARRGHLVKCIEFTIETLSGIPSIIYGLFGAIFFGEAMRLGYSILTGSLTLTIMVLPIIIRTTQEALKTVPESFREGALGIGATKWYMIRTIVLPSSLPGILTAVILSIGRIVGESAALIFTAGASTNLPKNLFTHAGTSGATLTVQMYFGVSNGKYINEGFGIALVLVVIVLLINLLTRLISRRISKN